MRIAILNETSAADRNADIVAALEGRGHTLINAGMKKNFEPPEITYIQTGLMAALLLNTGRADFVVAGCGTGLGFLSSVMQYPGVTAGHIMQPLDGWLFAQINGGNCVSLMLNQAYGWGSDVNLRMIFDAMFSVEWGLGYPPHRQESQQQSRKVLESISEVTHRSMTEILAALDPQVVKPALDYPGFWDLLDVDSLSDTGLAQALVLAKRAI